MPYKLVAPRQGYTPYWYVRGTERGIYINRSTETSSERDAKRFLKLWKDEAQRLALSEPKPERQTFAGAALSYMQSGRSKRFLTPLIEHFGRTPVDSINQAAIDNAAEIIYPGRTGQTRNRQVYTPTVAILKHAGVTAQFRRPKTVGTGHRIEWLKPPEAFSLIASATVVDSRLGALLTFLLYTGVRLSEALRLKWEDVDLNNSRAEIGKTKNGLPITVYLTAGVVSTLAVHNTGPRYAKNGQVFGITKCGRLYSLLREATERSGVILQPRSAFHILRHTHITWRRLYAGQDTRALLAVGLHKDPRMVERYTHLDITEEARKADLLPTPRRAK